MVMTEPTAATAGLPVLPNDSETAIVTGDLSRDSRSRDGSRPASAFDSPGWSPRTQVFPTVFSIGVALWLVLRFLGMNSAGFGTALSSMSLQVKADSGIHSLGNSQLDGVPLTGTRPEGSRPRLPGTSLLGGPSTAEYKTWQPRAAAPHSPKGEERFEPTAKPGSRFAICSLGQPKLSRIRPGSH
jgi:hypothetical protein